MFAQLTRLLVALLATLSVVSALEQLQIGILKKVPDSECRRANKGDIVDVHYTGSLTDGTVFDSSFQRNKPITFTLGTGQVIAGWDQGLLGMCVGEKRKLSIPSHLGYGKRGAGAAIPPNADLVFVVDLVDVHERDEL